MTSLRTVLLGAVLVAVAAGCKKEEAAPAAPQQPACNTKIPELGACLYLPPGYALGKVEKGDDERTPWHAEILKDKYETFTINASTDTIEEVKSSGTDFISGDTKIAKQGDLLGGKGWWYTVSWKDGTGGTNVSVAVQVGKYTLGCDLAGTKSQESIDEILNICRTIAPAS